VRQLRLSKLHARLASIRKDAAHKLTTDLSRRFSRRYENKSTMITTNRPFARWREVFPNAACVVPLVDRLVHNAEILAIDGDSYRLKEA
jgi:DNA replication protein DnaC